MTLTAETGVGDELDGDIERFGVQDEAVRTGLQEQFTRLFAGSLRRSLGQDYKHIDGLERAQFQREMDWGTDRAAINFRLAGAIPESLRERMFVLSSDGAYVASMAEPNFQGVTYEGSPRINGIGNSYNQLMVKIDGASDWLNTPETFEERAAYDTRYDPIDHASSQDLLTVLAGIQPFEVLA